MERVRRTVRRIVGYDFSGLSIGFAGALRRGNDLSRGAAGIFHAAQVEVRASEWSRTDAGALSQRRPPALRSTWN